MASGLFAQSFCSAAVSEDLPHNRVRNCDLRIIEDLLGNGDSATRRSNDEPASGLDISRQWDGVCLNLLCVI